MLSGFNFTVLQVGTLQFGCKVLISEQNHRFSTMEKGMQVPQMNSSIAELKVISFALFAGFKLNFVWFC
jgi:hypothetical protein